MSPLPLLLVLWKFVFFMIILDEFIFQVFHIVTNHIWKIKKIEAGTAVDGRCRNSSIKWNVPWYILLFAKMLWGWKCCRHKRKTWYGYSCCIENCLLSCSIACAFILLMHFARLNWSILFNQPLMAHTWILFLGGGDASLCAAAYLLETLQKYGNNKYVIQCTQSLQHAGLEP